jgi:hypothetical protein
MTKKKLSDMMVKYEVDAVDLPVMESRVDLCKESKESQIEDRGQIIRTYFDHTRNKNKNNAQKPTNPGLAL